MRGSLITIEGTDCSGKETQTKLLVERLRNDGYKVGTMSFPVYNSPTGMIIGACLLGKPHMCKDLLKFNHGFFPEGGGEIDAIAACDFYAADRRYNLPTLINLLENNDIVVVDRYVGSNMAHRGSMEEDYYKRIELYRKIELLEYKINELPRPSETYVLYLPYEYACELKKNRDELLDEAERNEDYLRRSEAAYLELASIYKYQVINCFDEKTDDMVVKGINDINDELYSKVKKRFLVKK